MGYRSMAPIVRPASGLAAHGMDVCEVRPQLVCTLFSDAGLTATAKIPGMG